MYSHLEQRLLNEWQREFPLEPKPYALMAEKLGMSESDVIGMLNELKEQGAISRIGAVVKPGSIGASTLAAMAVPQQQLEKVADRISAYPEVNHNYERDHRFNLWFVVTAPDEDALTRVLDTIEHECELPVMSLPMIDSYHIDLGFDLRFSSPVLEVQA